MARGSCVATLVQELSSKVRQQGEAQELTARWGSEVRQQVEKAPFTFCVGFFQLRVLVLERT